jgi:hypothetical protein
MKYHLGFKWSHTDPRLATVCGNGNFYAWTPVGSAITDLRPTNIIASALKADRADWRTFDDCWERCRLCVPSKIVINKRFNQIKHILYNF